MKKAILAFLLILCASAGVVRADGIIAAKIHVDPPEPYVGQEASLFVELATEEGYEIRNVSVLAFPATNYASLGRLVELPVQEKRDDDGNRWIHCRFRAPVRPGASFDCQPSPILQLELGRVVPGFFGSHWMFSTVRVKADCPRLVARELPAEGRPDGFSGAVGDFSLDLSADHREVWTDDIVNLTLRLHGKGYAGETAPSMPDLPKDLFRAYAPKMAPRDDPSSYSLTQSVIPLSTQAVEIASASFPYFDPVAGRYEIARSEPVRLVFRKREAGAIPAVREVKVRTAPDKPHAIQPLEVNGTTLRNASRALSPVLAGLLAGLVALAFARGLGLRYRTAVPIGLLVAAALFPGVRRHQRIRPETTWSAVRDVPLRLAPSGNARLSLEIEAGTEVEPTEKSGSWVRVRAHGRAGWLPASAIERKSAGSR